MTPTCPLCKGTEFKVDTPGHSWVFVDCTTPKCHWTRTVLSADIIAAAFALRPAEEQPDEISDLDYHGQFERFTPHV